MSTAVSLVGLFLYGSAYYLAVAFYGRFGVTPQDVGWSQVHAIAKAAFFSGVTAVLLLLGGAVGGLLAYSVAAGGGWGLRKLGWRVRLPRWLPILAQAVLAVAVVLRVAFTFYDATVDVRQVADGLRDWRQTERLSALATNWAGIDVAQGIGAWVEPAEGGISERRQGLVVLLGESDGTSILYDVCSKSTARVPTDSLVLYQSSEGNDVPDDARLRQARADTCRSLGRQVAP